MYTAQTKHIAQIGNRKDYDNDSSKKTSSRTKMSFFVRVHPEIHLGTPCNAIWDVDLCKRSTSQIALQITLLLPGAFPARSSHLPDGEGKVRFLPGVLEQIPDLPDQRVGCTDWDRQGSGRHKTVCPDPVFLAPSGGFARVRSVVLSCAARPEVRRV